MGEPLDKGQGPENSPAEEERLKPQAEPPGPPPGSSRPRPEEPRPFSGQELRLALRRPDRLIEHVLGSKERLAASLSAARSLGWLALLLFLTSLVSTVPYGALSPVNSFWKVAVLYTGSMLICFPCLHVFAQFFGFRFGVMQNLALALVITGVAGLFTFGFFPIIWFIGYTTRADVRSAISPSQLSVLLLAVSLGMGIGQMGRCLILRDGPAEGAKAFDALIVCWLPLLVFITYRMAWLLAVI